MGDTGSFYFGQFRAGQRHGLGLLFVPLQANRESRDRPAAAASSSSICSQDDPTSPSAMESFSIHAAIWRKDSVHACWIEITEADDSASAASSAAAAASAPRTAALGPKELLVWQAVLRLLRHAAPAVLRLQHHQLSAAAPTSAAAATGAAAVDGATDAFAPNVGVSEDGLIALAAIVIALVDIGVRPRITEAPVHVSVAPTSASANAMADGVRSFGSRAST